MITAIIILGCVAAWAAVSRYLFRYWVRNDTITSAEARCPHGYRVLHMDHPCHPWHPAAHGEVAACAIAAALFLPVTLFLAFVMSSPPLGRRELEEKTRALEAENTRLRKAQEPGRSGELT